MTGKIFVVIITLILLFTGSMLFLKLPSLKLPQLNLNWPNMSGFSKPNPTTESAELKYNLPRPTPSARLLPKTPKPQATPKSVIVTQPKACSRYLITHLDGSTSNLCYSQSDYNQLVNLGYQLSSAKTFYQFHLDGVAQYQAEYDKTKSSIYLDAKASQQQKVDQEKVKIDQITSQMYNLEAKGY